jgi:transposase
MRRKPKRLKKPYPPVAEITDCGLTLFDAGWEESYRLARRQVIVTIDVGARRKKALMFPTCAKIGVNPHS